MITITFEWGAVSEDALIQSLSQIFGVTSEDVACILRNGQAYVTPENITRSTSGFLHAIKELENLPESMLWSSWDDRAIPSNLKFHWHGEVVGKTVLGLDFASGKNLVFYRAIESLSVRIALSLQNKAELELLLEMFPCEVEVRWLVGEEFCRGNKSQCLTAVN